MNERLYYWICKGVKRYPEGCFSFCSNGGSSYIVFNNFKIDHSSWSYLKKMFPRYDKQLKKMLYGFHKTREIFLFDIVYQPLISRVPTGSTISSKNIWRHVFQSPILNYVYARFQMNTFHKKIPLNKLNSLELFHFNYGPIFLILRYETRFQLIWLMLNSKIPYTKYRIYRTCRFFSAEIYNHIKFYEINMLERPLVILLNFQILFIASDLTSSFRLTIYGTFYKKVWGVTLIWRCDSCLKQISYILN